MGRRDIITDCKRGDVSVQCRVCLRDVLTSSRHEDGAIVAMRKMCGGVIEPGDGILALFARVRDATLVSVSVVVTIRRQAVWLEWGKLG